MLFFNKLFILFLLLSILIFNEFFEINEDFSIHSLYIWYFLFIIFINYKYNSKVSFKKLDLDLSYKFLLLFFKTPSFLYNYITNVLIKVYSYLIFFKFRYIINTWKIISRAFFNNFFLIWRPLFKKTSYFGYYRSNRSKWIK